MTSSPARGRAERVGSSIGTDDRGRAGGVARCAIGVALALLLAGCERSTDVASTPATTSSAPATGTAAASPQPTPTPDSGPTPAPTVAPTDASAGASTDPPVTISTSASRPGSTEPSEPSEPSCLAGLSVRERAALLVWPAVYSQAWPEAIATVSDVGVGGVMLMKPSGWDPGEVAVRLGELEQVARLGLVIATDQEGGDVQRLRLLGALASQQEVSQSLTPDAARDLVGAHAETVRSVGIDVVFGPVVDVVPGSGEVSIGRSRLFTGDAATVADFARAYVDGWESAGILPVLKHFPGHGSASADTHLDAALTDPLASLEAVDLVPYRELAGRGVGVMVGHLTVPDLTDGEPATRSSAAIDLVRDLVGPDTLVVSDALGMNAVGLAVDRAAVAALAAGIDVALFTDTTRAGAVVDAVVGAVEDGTIPLDRLDASARRVLRITGRAALGCDPG